MALKHHNLSRPVQSSQAEPHQRLAEILQRHEEEPWQLKVHQPSKLAFEQLQVLLNSDSDRPLILDSGCGTGQSTSNIARVNPDCWVVGVDQSVKRLQQTGGRIFPHRLGNTIWVRAELASFWWLAKAAHWKLSQHYILYPNPWPKPSQLRRRWHGHPAFPTLLALGGVLELRCNWEIYSLEFAAAVRKLAGIPAAVECLQQDDITSPFENKYRKSGLPLFRVKVDLDSETRSIAGTACE